ncbi:hypothetical protein N825_32875 [Skermanella stibiiresistens SB22]|uniref:Uncharacterized protein n=1 Tax=Skermanella stibiiresistens SB22 TaxID=1385369 RepID=W9HA56_9PROT|nr:hypothetical protein N825_32875 [Skermanella stibiiresistens SB22]
MGKSLQSTGPFSPDEYWRPVVAQPDIQLVASAKTKVNRI